MRERLHRVEAIPVRVRTLYRHPQVMQTTGQAKQVVRELFSRLPASPPGDAGELHARAVRPILRERVPWPTTSPA
jgi:hypothetical protein